MHILCPHCQNPIELVKLTPREEILCPSCGSSFKLESETTTSGSLHDGLRKLGRFEVIDRVGLGAFGTVYKARDPELDRVVAVKVPRAGSLATQQDLDRFLREARSVAQLRHPSIVSVHEVGQQDGVPFLVEDFVHGLTLADLLTARRPAPREAAQLIAAVADTLQYAHEQGVIHRDVKPSNIMLDEQGQPHLMDFGLAKRDAGEVTVTVEGQVLGTPAYMSPEQAKGEGHQVDGRSDVYSLGVILYELLTGELPFRGNTRMLLHQVLHDEPKPPRRLNDKLPRDLETICLKAMAKEAGRRYPSARELADDLRRFLSGEPIRARPAGEIEKLWRWAKRRPAAAALLAVSVASALGLLTLAVVLWRNAEQKAALAQERAELAQDLGMARQELQEAGQKLEQTNTAITQKQQLLQQTQTEVRRAQQESEQARANLRRAHYPRDITLAHNAWESDNLAAGLPLLERHLPDPDLEEEDLRGFEWHYLWRLYHSARHTLQGHPDSKSSSKAVKALAFSADGKTLVSVTTQDPQTCMVRVWDVASGKERGSFRKPSDQLRGGIAFRPDGKALLTIARKKDAKAAFSKQDLQAVVDGKKPPSLQPFWNVLEFHPLDFDGKELPAESFDPGRVPGPWENFDATDKLTGFIPLKGQRFAITCVARSPDSKRLALGGATLGGNVSGGTILLWDLAADQQENVLYLQMHQGVRSVAFSPDGKTVASSGVDRVIRFWDVATGQELMSLGGSVRSLHSLGFFPDGKTLAAAAETSYAMKSWDVATGRPKDPLKGHLGRTTCVAFAPPPGGSTFATGSYDGAIKLWDLATVQQGPVALSATLPERKDYKPPGPYNRLTSLAFAPDGKALTAVDRFGAAFAWALPAAKPRLVVKGMVNPPQRVALAPDGKTVAVLVGRDVQLWYLGRGEKPLTLPLHEAHKERPVTSLALSPDGKTVATYSTPERIALWDAATGKLKSTVGVSLTTAVGIALSPDGSLLASGGTNARLWDVATGKEQVQLERLTRGDILAFSRDGKQLATASRDGTVTLWDTATGKELATIPTRAVALAFSPDGKRLATVGGDDKSGGVRLWDTATGFPVITFEPHTAFASVAFSADGHRLAAATLSEASPETEDEVSAEVRVWDATPLSR